nr:MAG TPA: hypothetical protein [Caudoviricetes sp.]
MTATWEPSRSERDGTCPISFRFYQYGRGKSRG